MTEPIKTRISCLAIGESGSGKTQFGATYPKFGRIGTEPGGFETIENKQCLLNNCVINEEFVPSPAEDIKDMFIRMNEYIKKLHEMQAKGEIETLFFDNMSYHSENRWMYMNQYEKAISSKTGNIDTQSMYGTLGRYLFKFTLMNLCSFKGNVVVTSHIMKEGEEAMKKKANDDTDIMPDILGGFRNKIQGMFSTVLYMNNVGEGSERQFIARCNKGKGQLAKNRYGLPDTVKNISYQTIYDAILTAKEKGAQSGQ